jgi:feruloyl-CoA synthase
VGVIGLPAPGVEAKLVPSGEKLELRVRGPNVTPGYWDAPDAARRAFDAEGFYCLGDAVKWADPDDAGAGLLFDGRIAEDFKMSTGTWVSVGALRARAVAHFAPYVRDAVITGHDRDDVGMLAVPDLEACRRLCPDLDGSAPAVEILRHPAVRARFTGLLETFANLSTGSANRITRAIVLEVPPSLDAQEVTDKGSLNQRAVLARRAGLVDALYAEPPGDGVLSIAEPLKHA